MNNDVEALGLAPAEWPYSTHDEVSHLVMTDSRLLRARIDMLLEERRERRTAELRGDVEMPREWRLTPSESRILSGLITAKGALSKEALHVVSAAGVEPDTCVKIVDVYICKLRKKLAAHGIADGVQTVWGQGYEASADLRAQFALR